MHIPELHAPGSWACIDFLSDLHLQESDRATFEAWRGYMSAAGCDAIFILGDLFEAWVGDDAIGEPGFEAECAAVLRTTAARVPVFFMHGNRDFLVGGALMQSTGVQLLDDPTVLVFASQRFLLSHGDALCVADTDYQAFRRKVRAAEWQQQFLAQPLARRREVARGLRNESEERARSGVEYADVDATTAAEWLRAANAPVLIHGHTHKPREHALGDGLRRIVMSDWDALAQPARAEIVRVSDGAMQRIALA